MENGLILFTDRTGVKYRFNSASNGKVTSVTHPNGLVLTFSYNGSGRLKLVSSNQGYALVFDYNSAGDVSAACGFNRAATYITTSTTCASATIKTSYGYTSGKLTSATAVTGHVATYAYNGWNGALSCLTDPGVSTCKYTLEYTPGGLNEVKKQTLADGTFWEFYCSCVVARGSASEPFQEDSTQWTDPAGGERVFSLIDGDIKEYFDENGRRHSTGFYGGDLVYLKYPEENSWGGTLNNRGMVVNNTYQPKPNQGGSPIVQDIKVFPAGNCTNRVTCNLPESVTDPRGAVTTFTYDQVHGGLLTMVKPAHATPAGSVQAVLRKSYTTRSAWVKNASGGYVAEGGIALPWRERTCKIGATNIEADACINGAGDEVVTTYEYGPDAGPNNLLVRAKIVQADGQTQRVCYAYDAQGNKISETSALAGLTSCP